MRSNTWEHFKAHLSALESEARAYLPLATVKSAKEVQKV